MSVSSNNITPFLWFNDNAADAVDFYLTVFPDAKRTGGLDQDGKPVTITFELNGLPFIALNGGPHFHFTEAVSFVIACDSQAEIDSYWSKLLADGGKESQCGWLKDKFGLSWQVVPRNMGSLLRTPQAMNAMMKMVKLDMEELKRLSAQ